MSRPEAAVRRTLLRTAMAHDPEGRAMKLDYYLLSEDAGGLEQYGAEIVLERGGRAERASVGRVTPLACSMVRIIAILAQGTVTPTTLREVLADIL